MVFIPGKTPPLPLKRTGPRGGGQKKTLVGELGRHRRPRKICKELGHRREADRRLKRKKPWSPGLQGKKSGNGGVKRGEKGLAEQVHVGKKRARGREVRKMVKTGGGGGHLKVKRSSRGPSEDKE